MMLCSRCKKRPAVVMITSVQNGKKENTGYCLVCARELHIPQIDEYMKQMGLTDDDLEQISNQMMDLMDGTNFEMGGSDYMPAFFENISKNMQNQNNEEDGGEMPEDSVDLPAEDDGNQEPASYNGRESRNTSSRRGDKGKKKRDLKFLNNYCTNLSRRAAEGELDPVVGRDKEISRVIQILSRRTKNNPCLIGEPGVGKTAIAEGIALRINEKKVPMNLQDKQVYLLDLTSLVAGTQFRGQFESRVKGLLNEVRQEGNIILFIDEIHNLIGAGNSEGSMNAANLLKPALSRREVQVIGATTYEEYRKFIEKDSALERRFQPVKVDEPTIEDTVEILKGVAPKYEQFHRVHISDEMLRLCAVLSERYINDRFLPDKAIDLLDESCTCAALRSTELQKYDEITKQKESLEEQEREIEEESDINFEELAKVKAELIRVNTSLDEAKEAIDKVQVNEDDIANVIELWTGIPAQKIAESEYVKLANLEDRLNARVIGQEEAVSLLSKSIIRTRVQLSPRRRPASFIFVGPTGVGKTELVKVLADELFDATDPLIRLDMTEYMEKHSVSRMIGSPPGYVGYDEAGQLTEKVRRKPYSVILFDEIEKAHPDVMNILMQILDEGKIEDAQGRVVNFEHTVICMTSNAGSTDKSIGVGFNRTETEISKDKAMKALQEFLRPEFLSRIDEIVCFRALDQGDYAKIAKLMVEEMREPLAEKGLSLSYDDAVLQVLAEKSFGKSYGAREIRKVIRTELEDPIASLIVENVPGRTAITIEVVDSDLRVVAS